MNEMDWEILCLMVKVAEQERISPLTFINLQTGEVSIPQFLTQMDQVGAITREQRETIEGVLKGAVK